MNLFDQNFTAEQLQDGHLIAIDKPLHWTSFQVVNKVRWHLQNHCKIKKLKVGHAGTLDPLATGLLLLCTGKMTKSIEQLQGQEKVYTGQFVLGASTPSYDLETPIDQYFPTEHITAEKIREVAQRFTGTIDQKPPLFSALKKEGRRLYEIARAGETVEIASRKVHIASFEMTAIELPILSFRVRCSKGTYIRSLAHDFGKALDTGAHLSQLRRTAIGEHHVDNAFHLEIEENQTQAQYKEN